MAYNRFRQKENGTAKTDARGSQSAWDKARAHGIAVVPGSCPNQFLKPDFGYAMTRGLWRLFGFIGVN